LKWSIHAVVRAMGKDWEVESLALCQCALRDMDMKDWAGGSDSDWKVRH
jgi:hypothetical protein